MKETPEDHDQTPFAQTAEAAEPFPIPMYMKDDDSDSGRPQSVTWTASEFIAHNKTIVWYLVLAASGLVLAVLLYLLTKDKITAGVVLVGTLLLGVYGSHQPRAIEYELDLHGIRIGERHYPYEDFRSFSVITEGAFSNIVFMPLKRFSPPLTLYYGPDEEAAIADILAGQLPIEPGNPDLLDTVMRKIRF